MVDRKRQLCRRLASGISISQRLRDKKGESQRWGSCHTSFFSDVLDNGEGELVLAVFGKSLLDSLGFFLRPDSGNNGMAMLKERLEDMGGDEAGASYCKLAGRGSASGLLKPMENNGFAKRTCDKCPRHFCGVE